MEVTPSNCFHVLCLIKFWDEYSYNSKTQKCLKIESQEKLTKSFKDMTKTTGEKLVIRFKKLSKHATTPVRASSIGFELLSACNWKIPSKGLALILTDIQIQLPKGVCGYIISNPSSLIYQNHIIVAASELYHMNRENVGVVLFNTGKIPYEVKRGDPIAQLLCGQLLYPKIEEVVEQRFSKL